MTLTGVKGQKINHRKHQGVKGRRPDKKEQRRAIASVNVERWRSLTPKQQLAELDRRLGQNLGAKKQRARINKAILVGQ